MPTESVLVFQVCSLWMLTLLRFQRVDTASRKQFTCHLFIQLMLFLKTLVYSLLDLMGQQIYL